MTIQEIASRLAELCKKGEFEKAQKELYADDAISIEPDNMPGAPKETKGLENLNKKIGYFMSDVEKMYSIDVSEPLIASSAFAFTLTMDLKMKDRDRSEMKEICAYEVKDGKITSEQFFF